MNYHSCFSFNPVIIILRFAGLAGHQVDILQQCQITNTSHTANADCRDERPGRILIPETSQLQHLAKDCVGIANQPSTKDPEPNTEALESRRGFEKRHAEILPRIWGFV